MQDAGECGGQFLTRSLRTNQGTKIQKVGENGDWLDSLALDTVADIDWPLSSNGHFDESTADVGELSGFEMSTQSEVWGNNKRVKLPSPQENEEPSFGSFMRLLQSGIEEGNRLHAAPETTDVPISRDYFEAAHDENMAYGEHQPSTSHANEHTIDDRVHEEPTDSHGNREPTINEPANVVVLATDNEEEAETQDMPNLMALWNNEIETTIASSIELLESCWPKC